MSGVRDGEGDLDAAAAEPAPVDGGVSAVPGADVSGPGRDGAAEEAAAGGDADPAAVADGDGGAGPVSWREWLDQATHVTPEGLGYYLTALVSAKNAHYPEADAELFAAGMVALMSALKQTCGHPVDVREELRGFGLFLQINWPMS